MEFLRNNGQVDQRASRIDLDETIRITIIWSYKDKECYEKCKKFHGKWTEVGGEYIAKASGYRGHEVWNDKDIS